MRRTLGTIVVMLTMGGLLAFVSPPAMACSCVGISDAEAYQQADVVFEGRVRRKIYPDDGDGTYSSGDPMIVVFQVHEVHKGKVGDRARVRTARSGASCGLEVRKGVDYLVFAERRPNGRLRANLCNGTRPIGDDDPDFSTAAAVDPMRHRVLSG